MHCSNHSLGLLHVRRSLRTFGNVFLSMCHLGLGQSRKARRRFVQTLFLSRYGFMYIMSSGQDLNF